MGSPALVRPPAGLGGPRRPLRLTLAAVGVVLIAACSSPVAGPATGASAPPIVVPTSSEPTPSAPASRPTSLGVSTPVAPEVSDGDPGSTSPATPAQAGRPGVTQQHPFAPSSVTLDVRGAKASAAVEVIDTTPSGELSLPADPGRVGWWQSGAEAGDAYGTVVLAGHIDSRDRGVGFFARLLKVRTGDEVVLGDGGWQQRYRVVSTRDVPKASLATGTDTFSQGVPGRLVLLTCTGPWDPVTHYPDNLVVTAEPVGGPAPVG